MTEAEERALRRERIRKIVDGLRIIDDDLMTNFFDGSNECMELVLRIVMDMPELKVMEVRTQKELNNLHGRSVQMDVLAVDGEGRIINVEIQRADKGAGSRRARYHSSILDTSLLDKGEDFGKLPETYVIFITEHDVLGRGEAVYKIERCILNTGELFDDGAHILYVNGAYRGDTPVGRLMHDFFCTRPEDMHYTVLAGRAEQFKNGTEGSDTMCRAVEELWKEGREKGLEEGRNKGREEGREKGREEGREEGQKLVAQRMLAIGKLTLEEIAECAGLTLDEVKRLRGTAAT